MWSYSSKKYTNMAFFNMGIGQILFAKEYPELMKEIMIQKINTCYIISNITGVIYLRKALLLVTQRVNKKDSRCIAIILIMTINISLQKLLYEEINHEKKSQTFSCYITAQYYNHPYVFEDS
jgi:hypothetical protein